LADTRAAKLFIINQTTVIYGEFQVNFLFIYIIIFLTIGILAFESNHR
jgi:hypothetical protein